MTTDKLFGKSSKIKMVRKKKKNNGANISFKKA